MDGTNNHEGQVQSQPTTANTQTGASATSTNRLIMAILAYVLFIIPIVTGDTKRDEFVKFHTKQGFALCLASIGLSIIGWALPLLRFIPIIPLLQFGTFVLFIVGVVNVATNKKSPLPVVGRMGDWLKI